MTDSGLYTHNNIQYTIIQNMYYYIIIININYVFVISICFTTNSAPGMFVSICSRPVLLAVTPETLPSKQADSFKVLWLEVDESIKSFFRRNVCSPRCDFCYILV